MRTTGPAGAAFSAACSDRPWETRSPAAAGIRPVDSAGPVRRTAVRPAAALPPPPPPIDGTAGRTLLPSDRDRRLLLSPAGGGRAAAGLCCAGGPGRSRTVFRRVLGAAAARVGLLGGYAGVSGPALVLTRSVDKNFSEKNRPSRKKALLFFEEMLYNKKKRMEASIPERRRRIWQKRKNRSTTKYTTI